MALFAWKIISWSLLDNGDAEMVCRVGHIVYENPRKSADIIFRFEGGWPEISAISLVYADKIDHQPSGKLQ